jgi:ferredoxin
MQNKLKTLRIVISTLIFILFLAVFCIPDSAGSLTNFITSFQFIPVVLTMLGTFTIVSILMVAGLLVVSLVFGRVYCASFCPLGIFQDIIIYIADKLGLEPKKSPQNPLTNLRLGVLAITLVSMIIGSIGLLNLIDPYSLFGRITSTIFKPAYAAINNTIVSILENFNIYTISYINLPYRSLYLSIVVLVIFLALIIVSALRGRKYCNSICPVGTILSYVSKAARFKINIDHQECINCKICESNCRAGCIDIDNSTIDHTRCTLCFDCIGVCPERVITYGYGLTKPIQKATDESKRSFFASSFAFLSLPLLGNKQDGKSGELPVIPPGGKNHKEFLDKCTGCHLCVNACPSNVIVPAIMDYGLEGLFQPKLDFNKNYCAYDCNLCTEICPTEALSELTLEEKQLTQLGEVSLNKDQCVVYRNDTDCGACIEHCPTHAVYADIRNGIRYPVTDTDYCIGCGACQYPCPTDPKAIVVIAHKTHGKAKPPFSDKEKEEETSEDKEGSEEFPF